MEDGDFIVIQYWFFYCYNDFGFHAGGVTDLGNDHEGDWESVVVFLPKTNGTAYTAYSHHVYWPYIVKWQHRKAQEYHPDVYVACGSHASYPKLGNTPTIIGSIDSHLGNCDLSIGPGKESETHKNWNNRVDLSDKKWSNNYAGHWGAVVSHRGWRIEGTLGPHGPAFSKRWAEPVKWAKFTFLYQLFDFFGRIMNRPRRFL
jgi:hypothetical protein